METRGPIEAGLGWCVKEDTGFIGAEAIKVAREQRPVARCSSRSCSPARASPARATRSIGGGEVTSGTLSPSLNQGIGMAYVPVDKAEPGTALEIDVRGRTRAAEVRDEAAVQQGDLTVAEASYPDDLKYHAEHDWARVDGDTATLGITWYAQDQLGEVVFFDPPEVGTTITKDSRTPRSSP